MDERSLAANVVINRHPHRARTARCWSGFVSPEEAQLPTLLTAGEVAGILRTSTKAIYLMIERLQLPGIVRIGRRVLIRHDALLDWLRQKSAPSPKELRR